MPKDAGFYAILPANIRYDKSLPANTKLLYAEITALCRTEGYCWATTKYFQELFGVDERTIERWIKKLVDKKYIYRTIKTFRYNDGTVKKIRYIGLTKKSINQADKNVAMVDDKNVIDHPDNFVIDHPDKNVGYNKINNEYISNEYKDTKVSLDESSTELQPAENSITSNRSQRSLDIDEALGIWEEVMGYPLQQNQNERRSINSLLNRKDMDMGKLRMLVELVRRSHTDKYKRFSITCYTDLLYKTNDLLAWAHEKAAQHHTNSKVEEV